MPENMPTVEHGTYKHVKLNLYIKVLEVYPAVKLAKVRFEDTQKVTKLTFAQIHTDYEPA